jgi:hypothetical protein
MITRMLLRRLNNTDWSRATRDNPTGPQTLLASDRHLVIGYKPCLSGLSMPALFTQVGCCNINCAHGAGLGDPASPIEHITYLRLRLAASDVWNVLHYVNACAVEPPAKALRSHYLSCTGRAAALLYQDVLAAVIAQDA